MISVKEILFFFSYFIIFVKFNSINYKTIPNVSIVINGILFTIFVFFLIRFFKDSKDSFTFEVTPIKLCDGGPYMYSSNPERKKICLNNIDSQINCGVGFHGKPFDYTSFLNDQSENKTC